MPGIMAPSSFYRRLQNPSWKALLARFYRNAVGQFDACCSPPYSSWRRRRPAVVWAVMRPPMFDDTYRVKGVVRPAGGGLIDTCSRAMTARQLHFRTAGNLARYEE